MRNSKFLGIFITSLLLVCGSFFTIHQALAVVSINLGSFSPAGTDWQAGTSKTFNVTYSGFSTSKAISFEICNPSGAPCVAFGSNAPITGGSGALSVVRDLGAVGANTLYERLERSETPLSTYYNKSVSGGRNTYGFQIKNCAVDAAGAKSNCGVNYQTFKVIPYGATTIGTWGDWSTCNTTTCEVQTRTCTPAGATCTGPSTQPCSQCLFSPKVNVLSSVSSASVGGTATISWSTVDAGLINNFYCYGNAVTGATNWPPARTAISGTSLTTIGREGSKDVNFTTNGNKLFNVTCKWPKSGGGENMISGNAGVVVETSSNGGWGAWGPCSTNSCTTFGTKTRQCNNPAPTGGGTCLDDSEGGASTFCYGATCSDPKIDTVNNNSPLGNLPAGVAKVIPYTYKNFSSSVNKAQISICKTTSGPCQVVSTSEGPFTVVPNGSTSTVKSLGAASGLLYTRLVNGFSGTNSDTPLTAYYTNHTTYFTAYYKVCPYNSSTGQALTNCKYADFNLVANPNAPRNGGWSDWDNATCGYPTCHSQARTCTNPAPANEGAECSGDSTRRCPAIDCLIDGPKVSSISIGNLTSGVVWRAGETKTIRWSFSNFGDHPDSKTFFKTVSIKVCTKEKTNCSYWSGAQFPPADTYLHPTDTHIYISPATTNSLGNSSFDKTTGALLYNKLKDPAVARAGILAAFSATAPYEARLKICPTYSVYMGTNANQYNLDPQTRVAIPPGTDTKFFTEESCAWSEAFTLAPNINDDPSASFGMPSGQGCEENECVCVNGAAKRCGNPMRAGIGCPATASCTAGPVASLGSRMMASLSSVGNWFTSLFPVLNK